MDVKFENVSKVQGLLTVSMDKADYQENVDKALKDARKKVQMPGFRPGMVPMGLVQKMYGDQQASAGEGFQLHKGQQDQHAWRADAQ